MLQHAAVETLGTATAETRSAWRTWFAAVALVFLTEPVLGQVVAILGLLEPSPVLRYFWVPAYLLILRLVLDAPKATMRAAAATPLLLALACLAFWSTFWSIAPDTSLRRAFALALTMVLGWRLAILPWRELILTFAVAWSALVIASYGFALLWPAAGIMGPDSSHPGAWAGVWTHKNLLGNHMGAGVAFFLGACLCDPGRRRLWFGFLVATIGLILLSTSATALLLGLIVFGMTALGAALRRGRWLALGACTGLALALVAALGAALLAPDLPFHLLGRDPTLTGRTDIWSALSDAARQRPWLGYGFAAFWDEKEGPVYWIRDALGWGVPNAHNGWLELTLGLGLVGAVIAALHFLRTYLRAAAALLNSEAGRVAPAFLAIFLVVTLTEGYLLQDNNALWAVFVAMAAKLALKHRTLNATHSLGQAPVAFEARKML